MFAKRKDLSPILALLLIFMLLLVPTGSFAGPDDGCRRNWVTLTGTEDAGGGDPDNPVPLDGDDGSDRSQSLTASSWIGDESVTGSDPNLFQVVCDLIGALSLL